MKPIDYAGAGVHAAECDRWLEGLRGRLPAIGGFAAAFPIPPRALAMREPQLIACADGVGTKVLVARAANDFSTIGQDCVAMVLNDMLCTGAEPLFFLDYLAVGRFDAAQADAIVRGLADACTACGCELIGGETAELPGLVAERHFDLCGFAVGLVERARIPEPRTIRPGDVVLALPSSGIHANGLSLARRVLPEYESDAACARELLTPTQLYVRPVLAAWDIAAPKGLAHITGGGIPGNLSRCLPNDCDAVLDSSTWAVPSIFTRIAERGAVPPQEMFETFNMGLGLCIIVSPECAADAMAALPGALMVGSIRNGAGRVIVDERTFA